jgi:pimeloyl-ACP methyl ester carboxylesterase
MMGSSRTRTREEFLTVKPILIAFAVLALAPLGEASAQSWVFTAYRIPGAVSTVATDVNDSGVVIGHFIGGPSTSVYHRSSFVLKNGQLTILDFPGARQTLAFGMNNLGQVVGDYIDSTGLGKGFLWTNGQFTTIAYPGSPQTSAYDINDAGTIVGIYYQGNENFAFMRSGGGFVPLNIPNVADRELGINNAGTIVGIDWDGVSFRLEAGALERFDFGAAQCANCWIWARRITDAGTVLATYLGPFATYEQGLVWDPEGFARLSAPGTIVTHPAGINTKGTIVGWMNVALNDTVAFIATPLFTVDPSPDLVSGAALTSDVEALATKGRAVEGVAADGVSRILLRIPAHDVGESITVSLFNDGTTPTLSTSDEEDGALGLPAQTAFTDNVVTVTAVDTGTGPFAFAVYRAPLDFPRLTAGDSQKASRSVSLRIQFSGGAAITQSVKILRPPLMLVHGLWDSWISWDTLFPLVLGAATVDPRFSVGRASYDFVVGATRSAAPFHANLDELRANALGLRFNAAAVSAQINSWINQFKRGGNPLGVPVAAVQADIVAHSMGGVITRMMPLQLTFFSDVTFRKGIVHKLITLDTPHRGSPIAPRLLQPENKCVTNLLDKAGNVSLGSVVMKDGRFIFAAVGDLSPGSLALTEIAAPGAPRAPTHFVVGTYTNWSSLDSSKMALFMRTWCSSAPLAQSLTSTGWPAVFGEGNDGIVGATSQAAGQTGSAVFTFDGVVHSGGTTKLGFSLPSILSPLSAGSHVINMLNFPLYVGPLFTTAP